MHPRLTTALFSSHPAQRRRLHLLSLFCAALMLLVAPGIASAAAPVPVQQAGDNADFYFLMGMDSLRDLPTWHEARWLVDHARLVALSRHDVELDWDALERALPGVRSRVTILDMPELEIASHVIQGRVRNGQPIRHMVPRAVEAYIKKHGLYRDKA